MNLVIIGGGTAGWLSALYFNRYWPNYHITLIESTTIGILGAGEGSTPILPEFIKKLGIDENEFLLRVNGTKKISAAFEDWAYEGSTYDHYFDYDYGYTTLLKERDGFPKCSLPNDASNFKNASIKYSYHFNARLFASYLKEIALKRGVNWVDGFVKSFSTKTNGDISTITLENNQLFYCDFVIDCTGFKRLIIGNHYNSKWNSYKDHLLTNAAIPFFMPHTHDNTMTKSYIKAMKYGWMWKIALQNRLGCGYVFDKTFATEDDIKNEIKEYLGIDDIRFNPTIHYEPGSYNEVWKNNCIAIGLSSGFIEPMEATAIMVTIAQLDALGGLNPFDRNIKNLYNEFVSKINHLIMLYIRHHYYCNRDDSDFWIKYKNLPLPKELENLYKNETILKINTNTELKNILEFPNEKSPVFSLYSYLVVYIGNLKLKK
jgi:hypothetical protein